MSERLSTHIDKKLSAAVSHYLGRASDHRKQQQLEEIRLNKFKEILIIKSRIFELESKFKEWIDSAVSILNIEYKQSFEAPKIFLFDWDPESNYSGTNYDPRGAIMIDVQANAETFLRAKKYSNVELMYAEAFIMLHELAHHFQFTSKKILGLLGLKRGVKNEWIEDSADYLAGFLFAKIFGEKISATDLEELTHYVFLLGVKKNLHSEKFYFRIWDRFMKARTRKIAGHNTQLGRANLFLKGFQQGNPNRVLFGNEYSLFES